MFPLTVEKLSWHCMTTLPSSFEILLKNLQSVHRRKASVRDALFLPICLALFSPFHPFQILLPLPGDKGFLTISTISTVLKWLKWLKWKNFLLLVVVLVRVVVVVVVVRVSTNTRTSTSTSSKF